MRLSETFPNFDGIDIKFYGCLATILSGLKCDWNNFGNNEKTGRKKSGKTLDQLKIEILDFWNNSSL